MEEVNFSIEINGLMSLKNGISEQGGRCEMWGMNCAVPSDCSIRHPLREGKRERGGDEGGRRWEGGCG